MIRFLNSRKAQIALAIAVAFVAIVVPACRMVGCSMGGATPWGHMEGLGFFGDCGGTVIANSTPSAIVPATAQALTLALVGVAMMAMFLYTPRVRVQMIEVHASDPPPPPEDPRGERLLI